MQKNNLILIGMPGAGKSTVGVILAKRLGFDFIDTDLLIQAKEKCRLQQIIDNQGLHCFQQIEEQTLLDLNTEQSVIATGGSVIYCPAGMAALAEIGHLVYLQVPLESLQQRIADMGQRGLVMASGQSFAQLYAERTPLYQSYGQLTFDGSRLTAEQLAIQIEQEAQRRWPTLLEPPAVHSME